MEMIIFFQESELIEAITDYVNKHRSSKSPKLIVNYISASNRDDIMLEAEIYEDPRSDEE